MHCKKCGGRMFVDRMFNDNLNLELFCLACGIRKDVHKNSNAFGKWLAKQEDRVGVDGK